MRIVISESISLDGAVQAPGGPDEDTDGGFAHGGWSAICARVTAATCWSWGAPASCAPCCESLVDKLRLMMMPVTLGGGKSIFPDDGALRTLELVSTVTNDMGVHVCTYRPVADG